MDSLTVDLLHHAIYLYFFGRDENATEKKVLIKITFFFPFIYLYVSPPVEIVNEKTINYL